MLQRTLGSWPRQLLTSVVLTAKSWNRLGSKQLSSERWQQSGSRVAGSPLTGVGHGAGALRPKSTGTPSMDSPVLIPAQARAGSGGDVKINEAPREALLGDLPQWALARAGLSTPPKLLTLVIIHRDEKVLLGMKKRGFGKGYYNGFGGKVEKGEAVDDAATRELQEESGVTPLDLSKRGILTFHFDDDSTPWEVHVYHVSEIVGDPCETEEMAPKWFPVSEIPYEKMWSDDVLWYPEFLQGRHFKGSFYFENTTTLVGHSLRVTVM